MSQQEHLDALKKLAKALEVGDPYTHGHSERVARHAYMVSREMKLPRKQREKIRLAGALHDIGKLHIPRGILTKPALLTDEEFALVKRQHKHAIDVMVKEAGRQLDADVVRAFIAYYSGRRGIRLWLTITTTLPRLLESVLGTARQAVANAAVVGTTAVAVVDARTRPERQRAIGNSGTSALGDPDAMPGSRYPSSTRPKWAPTPTPAPVRVP